MTQDVTAQRVLVEALDALDEDHTRIEELLRPALTSPALGESERLTTKDLRRLRNSCRWNVHAGPEDAAETPDEPHAGREDAAATPGKPHAPHIVRKALDALAGPGADPRHDELVAPFLLYLHALGEAAWELSWVHAPIRTSTGTAEEWRRTATLDSAAAVDVDLAMELLELLGAELLAESAGATGSLTRWAERAGAASASATRLATRAAAADGAVAEYVATQAARCAVYYRALEAAAATAAIEVRDGTANLDVAIEMLRHAEVGPPGGERRSEPDGSAASGAAGTAAARAQALDGRVALSAEQRSELRAHRRSLEALREHRDKPWLRIDVGSVTYVYPFTLLGIDPDDAVGLLRGDSTDWGFSGITPIVLDQLSLDDVWKGDDVLGAQYEGAALVLPAVELPDGPARTLEVEVRISSLGNHSVRFRGALDGASPQDIYQAMLRVAPESADLRELGTGLGESYQHFGRLADLAGAMAALVAEKADAVVAAEVGEGKRAQLPLPPHGGQKQRFVDASVRPGGYHVVVEVLEASSVDRGRGHDSPVVNGDDLRGLVGFSTLHHPVRHGVSAVAEWTRYTTEKEVHVTTPNLSDDLILRTTNTTLLVSLGSPAFMVHTVAEAAEFVATVDGLFAGWQAELRHHSDSVRFAVAAVGDDVQRLTLGADEDAPASGGGEEDLDPLTEQRRDLVSQRIALQSFALRSRLTLAIIEAPSLVASPVMRQTIDELLTASDFVRKVDRFVTVVQEVLGDQFATLAGETLTKERERRELTAERATDRRLQIASALLAGIGLSGLAALFQAGYPEHVALAWTLIAVIVVLAAGSAIWSGWELSRARRQRPQAPAETRRDGHP